MELIILKSDEDYIRVKDATYLCVAMDKASVFPMDQLAMVETHAGALEKQGYPKVAIKKLVISEEPL